MSRIHRLTSTVSSIMKSSEIRQQFLDFFQSKEHLLVPSAPLVVKNDPTLMFTNAGMNQFKDFFLGNEKPKSTRVTDTQKCLRVSGKHNDLEEVGIDTYHHTMFEMLGNWSFGDYFKEEAIAWSWELLTDVFKLDKDRLYITIFEGDKVDGTEEDSEAYGIWKKIVDEDKILKCDKKDNFWEMGDTGPCGPCSEIHVDIRSQEEIDAVPGKELVNKDHPQVIEIWNLVFIQYQRMASGKLEELPAKHIDTGMGFERLAMVIQGKQSNYDTDVFSPLIEKIGEISGKKYSRSDKQEDVSMRVIADHVRAISFAIADGQLPSNTGAGYVIRRILRRAVRYGYTFLGMDTAFIYQLVDVLADQFDGVFNELVEQKSFISKVIQEEEISFLRTLSTGIKRLDAIKGELPKGQTELSGDKVFELYDTFGFPVDLTALIAQEAGLTIDEIGFAAAMKKQKARGKAAAESTTGDWTELLPSEKVQFLGYDDLFTTSKIVKYREVKDKKGTQIQLVLDATVFYPEGGGQVGDRGILTVGNEKIQVTDTKKENDLIIHFVDKVPQDVKAEVRGEVDQVRRSEITKNHTATHLVQAALKSVLGDHVAQKGSLVNEDLLRFDFAHFSKVSDQEIQEVEELVNKKIRENISLDEQRSIPIDDAISQGATALFGEKYGESVRMITFDPDYSRELCGGTHVQATGEIGLFKISSEQSVAAGVRRIEAVTSIGAQKLVDQQFELVKSVSDLLKNPKDVISALEGLINEKNDLSKKVERFQQQAASLLKDELISRVENINGVSLIIEQVEIDSADAMKQLAFDIKNKVDNLVLILAADVGGKPMIAAMIADHLVADKSLNAGQLVRELAKEIGGGGGGQPFFATAGGKDIKGLPIVVSKAKSLINLN